jgi:hypothetical protein
LAAVQCWRQRRCSGGSASAARQQQAVQRWHRQHVGSGGNAAAVHWRQCGGSGQRSGGVGSAAAAAGQRQGSGSATVVAVVAARQLLPAWRWRWQFCGIAASVAAAAWQEPCCSRMLPWWQGRHWWQQRWQGHRQQSTVGERAINVRGKGGQNKSPCGVLWADKSRALSHKKTRQKPTPHHANMSLEGIQKQNHVAKPHGQKIQRYEKMLTWPKDMRGARVRATK